MAAKQDNKSGYLNFQLVTSEGIKPPALSFHSCSVVQDCLYIYGGIDDAKQVQNRLFCYKPTKKAWSEIIGMKSNSERLFNGVIITEAPALSHHTANVVQRCYIIVVGGWDGHKRTSDVYIFDTIHTCWYKSAINGDVPVGLSSHTSTLISDFDLVIIGREGGIRTQRRSGDAFYFNIKTGTYKEATTHVSSRSGHTAHLVKTPHSRSYQLFVQGGRKGNEYEHVGSWSKIPAPSTPYVGNIDHILSNCMVCGKPKGRQHSTGVALNEQYLFVFGGELWSGVRNNVTNEYLIYDSRSGTWYRERNDGGNVPCLTGHTMSRIADSVLIFGGLMNGKCTNNIWEIQLKQ